MHRIVQLSKHTSLRTGGTPALYFRPHGREQLRAALAECRRRRLRWRVLGGGSNLLVGDGHLPCAVIHIGAPGFGGIRRTGPAELRVAAGTSVAALLARCRQEGLGGLEFLAGLPGTVGGAVAGNAGAWGARIDQRLESLRLVSPDGTEMTLPRTELTTGYRTCDLNGGIITEARFALEPADASVVAWRMAEYVSRRRSRHPAGGASAGCIFKNPRDRTAGRLLDACHMKGRSVGGAVVSDVHANFIMNNGRATAADVLALIERMRKAVLDRFGIQLELEIKHWPAEPRAA